MGDTMTEIIHNFTSGEMVGSGPNYISIAIDGHKILTIDVRQMLIASSNMVELMQRFNLKFEDKKS